MKKMYKYLAFAASVAVLAASCEKSQTVHQNAIPDENTPETGSYDPEKYLLGFSASFEKTRADLDDAGTITWAEGDKVKVFNSEGGSALYSYHGTDFEPDGTPLEKNGEEMQACFPADNYTWDTDHVKFTMPEAFESLNGIQNPMAGVVPADADETTSVELKNLGGIYEVKLVKAKEYGETVTKLELGNTDVNITGSATLSFTDGVPAIGALDGATSFTVEFASPVTLTSTAKSVYFFLPAAELSGMYVKAVFGKTVGGVTYEPYEQKTRNGSMSIARGGRKNMTFSVNGFFSGGDGSEDNPYLISSADDFTDIATLANATAEADGNGYNADAKRTFFGSAGVHYQQTDNIDFENAALTPIGVYNATAADAIPFQGTYDGGDKTLSNFTVTGSQAASTGLFEYVSGATLKNITIGRCSVTGENVAGILTGRCIGYTTIEGCSHTGGGQVTGRNSVGFIAHIYANTTVKNCTVSNLTVITAASGADANNQGGVVGFAGGKSSIESCSTSGTITFTGTPSGVARGGIVGKFDSTGEVNGCTNGAIITNGLVGSTGGIAGQLVNGTIVSCANTANVSGTSMVGGIVGYVGSTKTDDSATNINFITSCRNSADITGTANCVGGIAGKLQNGAVMSACYAEGEVKTSTYDVGGLVGLIQLNNNNATSRVYVYDCLANMNVSTSRASGACRTGGAVGNITTTASQYVAIDNCGVLDVTITAAGEYVGGFAGWMTGDATYSNRARIRNCYTLVESVPGSAKKGGFVGAVDKKTELRYDYFVADDSSDISSDTVKNNYAQKTAAEIKSDATCTAFNGNTGFSLTVGSSYTSALGWALTNGYPVPRALIGLVSE